MNYNILCLVYLLALFITACVKEDADITGSEREDGEDIEFTVPYSSSGWVTPAVTRGTVLADDRRVASIDALVYRVNENTGEETFAYYRRHTDLIQAVDGQGSFTIRLARSKSGEKYSVDFLASFSSNDINTLLNSVNIGDTRASVREKLTRGGSSVAVVSSTYLAAWSYIPPTVIDRDTDLGTVKLICAFVKLDLGLNWPSDAQPAEGLTNFKLSAIYMAVYGANAYMIPAPENYDMASGKVITPTVWPSIIGGTTTHRLIGNITDDYVMNGCYFFEQDVNRTNNNGQRFTLLVYGTVYDSEGTEIGLRYFPLRLKDPDNPDERLEYLRGHRYRVNITAIYGEGYTTVQDAMSADDDFGIAYDLLVNEEGDINHIVYNSSNFLGVSTVNESFSANGGSGEIMVLTDVPGGWTVSFEDEFGAAVTWITPTSATSGDKDQKAGVTYTVANYIYPTDRVAYAKFTAGVFEISTEIIQRGRSGE